MQPMQQAVREETGAQKMTHAHSSMETPDKTFAKLDSSRCEQLVDQTNNHSFISIDPAL